CTRDAAFFDVGCPVPVSSTTTCVETGVRDRVSDASQDGSPPRGRRTHSDSLNTGNSHERFRSLSGPGPHAEAAKTGLSKWQFTGCTPEHGECEAKFVVSFILDGLCDVNCPTSFEVNFLGRVIVTDTAPK